MADSILQQEQLENELNALLDDKVVAQAKLESLMETAVATKPERRPKEAVFKDVRDRDVACKKQIAAERKTLNAVTKQLSAKKKQQRARENIVKLEDKLTKLNVKYQANIKAEAVKIEQNQEQFFKKEEVNEDDLRVAYQGDAM